MLRPQTPQELVASVRRLEEHRSDYLVDPEAMVVSPVQNNPMLFIRSEDVRKDFNINDRVHDQLARRAEVPRKYYDRIMENHPELYEKTINKLLRANDNPMLVREAAGEVRGIMSNRYRRLDHDQLLQQLLPVIDQEEIDFERSSFKIDTTEGTLTMKLFLSDHKADVGRGDTVQYGLYVRNGEFGGRALEITPGIFRFICSNGMMFGDFPERVSRQHIGTPKIMEKRARQLVKDPHDNADVWKQLSDYAAALADAESSDVFTRMLEGMKAAKQRNFQTSAMQLVSYICEEQNDLQQGESEAVLECLFDGTEDRTQYGLSQAVTRVAHEEVDDYERSTELEDYGSEIINLDEDDWENLNQRADTIDEDEAIEIAAAD